MAKKKAEEAQEGLPEWMATYGDLVTLLLTFFILLFSMAEINKQKFEEIAISLKSSFVKFDNTSNMGINDGSSIINVYSNSELIGQLTRNTGQYDTKAETDKEKEEKQVEKFKENIEKALKQMNIKDEFVKVIETNKEIILRVESIILFDPGSADLKVKGKSTLKELSKYIKTFKNEIEIQGHTDNVPMNSVLFPSNWELSTKRATNVTLFFINECGLTPDKLTATGNGEFKPIAPNNSKRNREKNRRIDIVIEK